MNKKGELFLGIGLVNVSGAVLSASIFKILFGGILAACIWHIPAWTQAKHNHTEASYQAQPMWPQVQIAQWANGSPTKIAPPTLTPANGGNFSGGNSGPVN